jgi:ferric-dicitrate binding protein FerR (iron transport regulator)
MSDQDDSGQGVAQGADGGEAFAALVLRYLDGLTTAEENAGLNEALAGSPDARALFVWMCRQHGQLREVMMPRAAAAVFERRIRSTSSARSPAPRARLAYWPGWLAAAAAVLIAAGLFVFHSRPGPEAALALAVVTHASGEATIRRGEQSFPLSPGQALLGGEIVAAPAGGRVTLAYRGEASTIELLDAASVRLDGGGPGKRIALLSGKIDAMIAAQSAGTPMRITTPHASAEIVGTRFRMIVNTNDTRLRVSDGQVRFDQPAKGFSVVLSSNQYAIASVDARGQPASRSGTLMAEQHIVGETLFVENFGDDSSAELYVPDPMKFQGGMAPRERITPLPDPKPVAVFHEPVGNEPYITGERVRQQGVFWVTEKRAGKISHYAILNATQEPRGLRALVRPARFPGLDSFVIEFDMQSLLDVGDSEWETLVFAAARDVTYFRHPRRMEMYAERSRAGRYYHTRIEIVAGRDADGQKYYDSREYFDGTLILHQKAYADEHRIYVGCSLGCIKVDNFTVRRVETFE